MHRLQLLSCWFRHQKIELVYEMLVTDRIPEDAEGNVFTGVCLLTGGGEESQMTPCTVGGGNRATLIAPLLQQLLPCW